MGSVVQGAFGYLGAKKQASATREAAIRQQQAAEMAAEEARFRPVGITTRFGSATPQFDEKGRLSGYGYESSPEIQELQKRISGLYGGVRGSLAQAERAAALQPQFEEAGQGLFNLGQQFIPAGTQPELTAAEQEYLSGVQGLGRGLLGDLSTAPSADVLEQQARLKGFAGQLIPSSDLTSAEQAYLARTGGAAENILGGMSTQAAADTARQQGRLEQLAEQVTPRSFDPTALAQSYYDEQQALLAPSRRRQEQRVAAGVFGRGRGGLSVGAEGQPELFGFAQAYAEQDARLAAEARQRARSELREDINLGTTLGGQSLATGQGGRQEQLGLTSTGLNLMGAQQTAEEAARQRMLQNMGLSAQFGGQAVTTGQAGEQYRTQQALQGLGLLGQATTPEEQARQRLLQNIQTGTGLFGSGAGLFGTGYQTQQASMQPFLTQFGTAQQLEEVAQAPMQIGAALGAKSSAFGSQAAKMLQSGYGSAAELQRRLGLAQGAQIAGAGQRIGEDLNTYFQRQSPNAPIEEQSIVTASQSPTSTQQNTIPIWGGSGGYYGY